MEFDELIPDEEVPRGTTGSKKAMSKIHVGFDIELGLEGYTKFNNLRASINDQRKAKNAKQIPQKEFAMFIAKQSGVKTDNFDKVISQIQDAVKEVIDQED